MLPLKSSLKRYPPTKRRRTSHLPGSQHSVACRSRFGSRRLKGFLRDAKGQHGHRGLRGRALVHPRVLGKQGSPVAAQKTRQGAGAMLFVDLLESPILTISGLAMTPWETPESFFSIVRWSLPGLRAHDPFWKGQEIPRLGKAGSGGLRGAKDTCLGKMSQNVRLEEKSERGLP